MSPTEVACDESGFTGGNLTVRQTVFAHASVQVSTAAAEAEMQRLRRRVAARGELKASWLLRWSGPDDVRRLLDPEGLLRGGARVHLSDTPLFLLCRLADVVLGTTEVSGLDLPGTDARARTSALLLHRQGERVFGPYRWHAFLTVAGNALRTNSRWVPATAVDDFEVAVQELAAVPAPRVVTETLRRLRLGTDRLRVARSALEDDPRRPPLLEPLLPALTQAVLEWGAGHPALLMVHDEQSALTPWRTAEMARRLSDRWPGHRLQVLRVDSRTDPRVQIADLVAGIGRRAAASRLRDRADQGLLELVQPLVDPRSIWADDFFTGDRPGDRSADPSPVSRGR